LHLCKFVRFLYLNIANQYHSHNAGALTIVKAVHEQLPKATNIAFFDSAFHSSVSLACKKDMNVF
jgi:acetate kinase